MLKEYFFSEARFYFSKKCFYLLLLLFAGLGYFISVMGNFSFAGVYINSPYVLTYAIGLISLINIFTITIFSSQILLREKDNRFDSIVYATPLHKKSFLFSRFTLIFFITALCFLLFVLGLMAGHTMQGGNTEKFMPFNFIYYLYPYLVLVLPNITFCTAIVCAVGWLTKNKMLVYLSGLFIYILYFVVSLFSNSPLFANASPASAETMSLMAKLDPFGLAAFFEQCRPWSAELRNTQLVHLQGNFLLNRIWVLVLSFAVTISAMRLYRFAPGKKQKVKNQLAEKYFTGKSMAYKPVSTTVSTSGYNLRCLWSFVTLDTRSMIKSIPFVLILVLWVFFNGMEIFSDIDAGMRLPQRYATSGLMVRNIMGSFPFFILAVLLFYGVEMLWRSRNVKIDGLENSTAVNTTAMLAAKWVSLCVVPVILIAFSILMGVAFQFLFQYPHIEWGLYAALFYVLGVPALLCAGIIISIQAIIMKKFSGLVLAAVFLAVTNSFFGSMIGLQHPLFRFAKSSANYTGDMNGFGAYLNSFGIKMIYWSAFTVIAGIIASLAWGNLQHISFFRRLKQLKPATYFVMILALLIMLVSGTTISNKTRFISRAEQANRQQEYEQQYRKYQSIPAPAIVSVKTTIDLYPEKNSYAITGEYILLNKQATALDSVLLYCNPSVTLKNIKIENARLVNADVSFGHYSYRLSKPLAPGDSLSMKFDIAYNWQPYNHHDPMNAIVGNGSFMRISRYFPVFGYQPGNEIDDEAERKKRNMATPTPLKKIEAKDSGAYDYGFINFDAVISTAGNQTAIGTGELVTSWKTNGRNYFHYASPVPIPFRFGLSSANYTVKKSSKNGIAIEVYYDAKHKENVEQLISDAKTTLDYCETNFGKYPFKSIRFAEISGFTEGFNATAYPAVIFVNEALVFHADLRKEKTRDVINELAGHELSHEWWGNNLIAPDDREGAAMLRETLAMYTELMLYKNKHGKAAMKNVVEMYKDLYENGRLNSKDEPLYKVSPGNSNLSYNKGLMAMYELYELIGEEKINLALRHFLFKYAFPNKPPTTINLLNEFFTVSDSSVHDRIKKIFM